MIATMTILQKPDGRKVRVEIDLDQWERLADALGFYNASFIRTLEKSLKESNAGRVRSIESLRDLEE
ncbi:MAG: hypothetical protein HY472_01515 [Candidatus Sungbacteria bacterium]|nr:hypothetical protein [Candidatus Sungbacteria bacterium]